MLLHGAGTCRQYPDARFPRRLCAPKQGVAAGAALHGGCRFASLRHPPRRYEGASGGVAERLKAHAWRACMGATPSRVQIPLPPPEPRLQMPTDI